MIDARLAGVAVHSSGTLVHVICSFSVAGVCDSRENLKFEVVSAQMIAPPMALAP